MKCFSLTSYKVINDYDDIIVPVFRRMSYLEKLTLYLRIYNRSEFVSGKHLQNEILVHMPQLHTFIYYISTENDIDESVHRISHLDIQQTFTNIRYGQMACILDYFNTFQAVCHVFSIPFTFTRLEKIGNQFPPIVFNYVTHVYAFDVVPFKHEFFIRIHQAFPLLKYFSMTNLMKQSWAVDQIEWDNNLLDSVIEYSHLTLLDIKHVNIDYVEQFLLETKAYLPCLTDLKVNYNQLKTVTMNFTRDATRRNCANVKRLIVQGSKKLSKDVYEYFPSL